VEDERVENENQDDPRRRWVKRVVGGGTRTLNCVMVMVIVGGDEGGMEITNWLDLLNRSVTTPFPVNPSDTLFG